MYIAATAKRVFDAIVKPEFTREYWMHDNVSDWKPGSVWEHREVATGEARMTGKVVECDPPDRPAISWARPAEGEDPEASYGVPLHTAPSGGLGLRKGQ